MSLALVQSKPTAEEKMCNTGVSLRFSLFSHEYLWAGMWMEPSTNDCTMHFLCSQGTYGMFCVNLVIASLCQSLHGTCVAFSNGPFTGLKAREEFGHSNICSQFFVLCSVNLRWCLARISSIWGIDHKLFPAMSVLCHHSRIWRILAQHCQARGWKKRRIWKVGYNFDHVDWHHWCWIWWICWIWAVTCLQHQVLMHTAIVRDLHVWKELLKLMDQRKEQVSTSVQGTPPSRDEHFVVGPSRMLSTLFGNSWGHEELDWRQNYWCCLSWRKGVTS